MAFKRFSLRGFRSEFNIRRQVELFNGKYLVWTTLYRGTHIRIKKDEISTALPLEAGLRAAEELAWEFRNRLIERHSLEAVGVLEIAEEAG